MGSPQRSPQRSSPPKTPVQQLQQAPTPAPGQAQAQLQQRKPLHDRTNSASNTDNAGIRIVPYSPPRLSYGLALGGNNNNSSTNSTNITDYANTNANPSNSIYSRSALPTLPAHILAPAGVVGLGVGLGARSNRQGPALGDYHKQSEGRLDVSATASSPKSQATTHQHPQSSQPTTPNSAEPTPKAKTLPKKRKHVAVNPDNKTFRVLDVDQQTESQTSDDRPNTARSWRSLASPTTSYSSHDRASSDAAHGIDASVRSPSSCLPESTAASSPTSIGPIASPPLAEDHITSSPWNYSLVGGLRKVPKTPDLKHKAAVASDSPLPPLPETSDDSKAAPELATKASFLSTATFESTVSSDTSNYKVYGSSPSPAYPLLPPPSSRDSDLPLFEQSSPPESNFDDTVIRYSLDAPSETTSNPNYQVLGASSPAPGSQASETHLENSPSITHSDHSGNTNYQVLGYSSAVSSELDLSSANYQVYGDSSPATSQVVLSSQAHPTYSRESLVVPPLQPRSKRSTERFGYYKQRSRESLRTGSLTSITSVLSQEAFRTVITAGSVLNLAGPSQSAGSSSWANPLALHPARTPMQAHPHQWSSQLSTVPSESDGGTDRGSRSFSDGTGRRSSGFPSSHSRVHSRQMPSISSSLQNQEDNGSFIEDLEYPQPAFGRGSGHRDATGSTIRVVEDQDEYGDGLSDMPDLRARPSRNRLSDFYSLSSDNGRTNTMRSNRSTSSSRANSLMASSIPAWARLYYGSGERRYLGVNASASEISSLSRVSSFDHSNSPDTANFPLSIYSPRRRPRDINPNARRRPGTTESMGITPLPQLGSDGVLVHGPYRSRFRTSSIWSPHLGIDRRANSKRMTVWEGAPSINFSTESGMFGKRNRQLVMFIVGFIFPFAWMIASFLPLPPRPMFVMRERDRSTTNLDMNEDMAREFRPMDEARYESARWWRTLNRGMAVVGVLVIAAIVTLAVLGVTQNWAS